MNEEIITKKDKIFFWMQMPIVVLLLCVLIFSLLIYSPMAYVILLGLYIIYSILNSLRDNPEDQ